MQIKWLDKFLIWWCGSLERAWLVLVAASFSIYVFIWIGIFTSPPIVFVILLVYCTYRLNKLDKEKKYENL